MCAHHWNARCIITKLPFRIHLCTFRFIITAFTIDFDSVLFTLTKIMKENEHDQHCTAFQEEKMDEINFLLKKAFILMRIDYTNLQGTDIKFFKCISMVK